MLHSTAGLRQLRCYAARGDTFAEAGVATLQFDGRGFGASGGETRQLLTSAARRRTLRRRSPAPRPAPSSTQSGWRSGADRPAAPRCSRRRRRPSPLRLAAGVRAPLLVVAGERDVLCPAEPARRLAERAEAGRFALEPHGHFDLYDGVALEVERRFLAEQLVEA